jgi:hypothetical protein
MARATYTLADDGFPARDADTWTEEKLMILECYVTAFAKACTKAGGWYGLDVFAGAGLRATKLLGTTAWRSIYEARALGSIAPAGSQGRVRQPHALETDE